MSKRDDYVAAATRANTKQSYKTALRHFEVDWGGFLPATADSVSRYLADHAESLSINTLKQRLAAIAQWHIEQGFPDPTKAPVVRKTLQGIRVLHPAQERRAKPLQIAHLQQVVDQLERGIAQAREHHLTGDELRHTRNKALLLLGFWRGFRGDELVRLRVELIELEPKQGLRCFLAHSKGDRKALGRSYKVPALATLCPVTAYIDWIELSGLTQGPLFRGINRWGQVSEVGLHIDSLVKLMRGVFAQAGLASPEAFSSHSLRRGFAGWANANGWDVKTLMEYVDWKDVKSALRYIDGADPFATLANALPAGERRPLPAANPPAAGLLPIPSPQPQSIEPLQDAERPSLFEPPPTI